MRYDPQIADLKRLQRVKQTAARPIDPLGPQLLSFFKQSVQKRQTRLGALAECWSQSLPEHLLEHSSLEGFHGGVLKVIVDSAPHLYELKQLLLCGLEKQLLVSCRTLGLRKIALKPGRWYEGDGAHRRLRF